MKFYLGGPINGCSDDEANGWRDDAKATLAKHGHGWADPMERDYRGRELEPGIAAEIVKGDIADIDQCDVLLFNAPKPSWGTAMEIHLGFQRGKRVVVVMPEGVNPSPWVIHHSHLLLRGSISAALDALLPTVALWR